MKQIDTLLIAIAVGSLLALQTPCLGLTPLSSPRAVAGDQKWLIGFGLGHQSMDLQLDGSYSETVTGVGTQSAPGEYDMDNLKKTMVFGQFGFGLHEKWDLFLQLGLSDASGDVKLAPSGTPLYIANGEQFEYDSSMSFAWGLGTRITFKENANISWGALGQITFYNPSDTQTSWQNPSQPSEFLYPTLDLDYWEIQLAAGPTWNRGDFWIYGGPFLHFVDGDMSLSGTFDAGGGTTGPIIGNFDVQQKSEIGLYVGGQWLMKDNLYWHADAQFTGNAWGIGMGGLWRVE